ncbi:MAG: type II secretion system protein [Myxococcota bacterium]|nr:type II secretion system protein [Myxococcota bacterium]MEE2780399.1 type II secretion system protein [Myxococcota bacterium]
MGESVQGKDRISGTHKGFTLVEILMVGAILIVLVTLIMPNVMGGTQNQPLVHATESVMDVVHFAKNRAIHDFAAYGLEITPAVGDQPGRVAVYKGDGPQCGKIDLVGTDPVRVFDLDSIFPLADQGNPLVQVRITSVHPSSLTAMCFTPDGRGVDLATNLPVASTLSPEYAAGEATIVLQKTVGGSAASQQHNVLIPFSGKPRFTYGNDMNTGEGEGGA